MEQQQSVRDNPLAFESTGRLIAKYSVPSVIAMLVSSLYNLSLIHISEPTRRS